LEIGDFVADANRAAVAVEKVGTASKNAGKAAAVGAGESKAAAASVSGGFAQAAKDAEKSSGMIGGWAKKAGETFTAGISWAARAAVSGAAAALTIGMAKTGAEFEQNMAQWGAATQSTAAEIAHASEVARDLGKDIALPTTSASDAAEAMLELGKGGLSASESMAAARGTLTLAAAAQISGAEAAKIQTAALNTFGLSADHAGEVADVLAAVSVAASGDMSDFGTGMAQAGLAAHGMGIGLEDTATTLGIFANAGLSGSDAGTSMRTMLASLESPSKQAKESMDALGLTVYDSQGNFLGMRVLTDQLAQAQGRMTTEQFNFNVSQALGQDAMRAGIALAGQGVTGWDQMSDAVNRQGAAQDLAAARTTGLAGAWGEMVNAFEDVSLSVYNMLAPALTGVVGFLGDILSAGGSVLGWLSDLPGPIQAFGLALGAVVLLRGPLGSLWGAMKSGAETAALSMMVAKDGMTGFGSIATGALGMVKGAWNGLKAAFLSNPLGIILTGVATAISIFSSMTDDASDATRDFSSAIDENTGALGANAAAAISAELSKTGGYENAHKAGIAVETYTQAVMGNVDAQHEIAAAAKEANDALLAASEGSSNYKPIPQDAIDKASALNAVTGQLGIDQGTLATETQNAKDQIAGAGAAAGEAAGQVGGLGGATKDSVGPTRDLSTAWQDGAGDASDFAAQVQAVMDKMDELTGRNRDGESAQRDINAAVRDYNQAARDVIGAQDDLTTATDTVNQKWADYVKAVDESGASSQEATDAARDFHAAERDLAAKTEDVTKAQDDLAASSDTMQKKMVEAGTEAYNNAIAQGNFAGAADISRTAMEGVRESFINAQSPADIASGKAAALADQLGLIPANVPIDIVAENNASGTIATIMEQLNGMPSTKTVTVTVGTRYTTLSGGATAANNMGNVLGAAGVAWSGGLAKNLMGFDRGGLVPGRAPQNPREDNILAAYAGGGMIKIRSGEFIMSEPAVNRIGVPTLAALNTGYTPPQGAILSSGGGGVNLAGLEAAILRLAGARAGQTNNIEVHTADPGVEQALNNALFQLQTLV
jgi:TP901 family phage tail tape measure protein